MFINEEDPGEGGGGNTNTGADLSKLQDQISNLNTALGQLRDENKGYKEADATRAADLETKKKTDAEEQGKFKSLYDETQAKLTAAEALVEEFQGRETTRADSLKASNKERLEALPEDLRDLVPDGLSPDATAKQIARLEKRADTDVDGKRPAGARRGGKTSTEIPQTAKDYAKKIGKDPEWVFKTVRGPWNKPKGS